MILINQAKCLNCGDEPYSAHVYDFKYCECENIFVDGGMQYFRCGFKDRDKFMSLGVELDEIPFEMCMSALEWCDETGRNNLGRLCAVAIALRDCGYEIRKIDDE